MSSIKVKTGICIDCPPDGPNKTLIANRCQMHYWIYRRNLKGAINRKLDNYTDKQAQKKALDKWFTAAIEQMPAYCEECGDRLIIFAPWAAKAFVAHVLPKARFKSVSTHSLNKIYLCLICHTNFDNRGEENAIRMVIFPKVLDISMQLLKHLNHEELRRLPEYVKSAINEVV